MYNNGHINPLFRKKKIIHSGSLSFLNCTEIKISITNIQNFNFTHEMDKSLFRDFALFNFCHVSGIFNQKMGSNFTANNNHYSNKCDSTGLTGIIHL